MLAAQQEDIACVRLLLTHNADVHARDSDGDSGNLREGERAFRVCVRVCGCSELAFASSLCWWQTPTEIGFGVY